MSREYRLGDPWIYDNGGEYHLFYLRNPENEPGEAWRPWDSIGHAVSSDLLHWEETESVHLKSDNPSDWDGDVILSGDTFECDGRYGISYGAVDGKIQKIGLMLSDDLYTWSKLPQNPVLVTTPPYEYDPALNITDTVEFRDASIRKREDGVYEAIFCARMGSGPFQGRGAVGRAVSADCISWTFLEPLINPGLFNAPEMPNRVTALDWEYILFSLTHLQEGALSNTCYPDIDNAVFYATRQLGSDGFEFSMDNILTPGPNYTGRIVKIQDSYLYFHHTGSSRRGMLALPKSVDFGADGRIALKCWDGLKAIEQGEAQTDFGNAEILGKNNIEVGQFAKSEDCCKLSVERGTASAFLGGVHRDFRMSIALQCDGASKAGVLLRENEVDGSSIVFLLDMAVSEAVIGRASRTQFNQYRFEKKYRYRMAPGELHSIRLEAVVRSEGVDWYLNGASIYTTVHENTSQEGRIGFFVESGDLILSDLRLVALEPEKTNP